MNRRKILIYYKEKNLNYSDLETNLKKKDYIPIIAKTKDKIIDIFKKEKPQILLIDYFELDNELLNFFYENNKIKIFIIAFLDTNILNTDKNLKKLFEIEDFIFKPILFEEIILRIEKVFNNNFNMTQVIDKKYFKIDIKNYKLYINNKQIKAAPKEIELLYKLIINENLLLTREQLLDEVWGYQYVGPTRTVDVHIKRLRYKLKPISEKCRIETVWGVGYIFKIID